MAQCAYTHPTFKLYGPDDAFNATRTENCWVPEAKAFEIGGGEQFYCLFHAPLNQPSLDGEWPVAHRGDMQATHLNDLIKNWHEAIGSREQHPLAFVLPGLKCGNLEIQAHTFNGEFICEEAEFYGDFKSSSPLRFRGGVNFSASHFKLANFNGADFQRANFENATFEDGLFVGCKFSETKFTNAKFYSKPKFTSIQGTTDFSYATFFDGLDCSGKSNFTSAIFVGTKFKEIANFGEANFRFCNFRYATFEEADFQLAQFERASFRNAKFERSDFRRSILKRVNFKEAEFRVYAYFNDAIFDGPPVFDNVRSDIGQINFQSAEFKLGVYINESTIESIIFKDVTLLRPSGMTTCEINHLAYSTHTGERLTFNRCRQPKEANGSWTFQNQDCSQLAFIGHDFSRVNFMGADVSGSRFDSCKWPKGEKDKYVHVYQHNEIIGKNDSDEVELLGSLYRQLKKNQEENRNYEHAGDFHFREKDIRQRLLQRMKGRRNRLEYILLCVYRRIADYGENYFKIGKHMVYSVLGVALFVAFIEEFLVQSSGYLGWCFHLNCVIYPLSKLWRALKIVILGVVPSGFQRQILQEAAPHTLSMFIIVFLGLWLLFLGTLLVMAVRRRFRH